MNSSRTPAALKMQPLSRYWNLVLDHPVVTLAFAVAVVFVLALHIRDFELDASAESLVLEEDSALRYYRSISARYGNGDFLVVTYTPHADLFAPETLKTIARLRDELEALGRVESVRTLLDVPLLQSPPVTLSELSKEARTLLAPGTDISLARQELTDSPLYRNLLVGEEGRTTALYLTLEDDARHQALVRERDALYERQIERDLTPEEFARLQALLQAARERAAGIADQLREDIAAIRKIVARYQDGAEIHLAGTPLIVSDMIRFIWHDLRVFGAAVLAFIVLLLAISFKRPRWVVIPTTICAGAGAGMVGFLGWVEWRPTVVSSNFLSVLLIITLSLIVHLIVRYQELHEREPERPQRELVMETMHSKLAPSFYTALTTMVAFGSLVVSGIRPVIDFGWMMVIGIAFAFILVFLVFPASLMLLAPGKPLSRRFDASGRLTRFFANAIEGRPRVTLIVSAVLLAASVAGMARLSVENRFIDYFDESTEIYQGMVTVDRELGGTTPLEVILDAPAQFRESMASASKTPSAAGAKAELSGGAGLTGTSYWFNVFQLDMVENVHEYLQSLPETGKVLSLATAMALMEQVNEGQALDNFTLALVYERLPEAIKERLFDPYMSEDGNQLRFAVRIFESNPGLERDRLLEKIRTDLSQQFGLAPEQIHLTGLMVLYNNVLQSLFRSQVLTLGFVFGAIMLMLAVLFRSLKIAAIAIVPNILVSALVLGLIGWLGIPLDIMTITIAAIALGIAVDDTIHYTHRYRTEFTSDGDYWAAMRRCHASVGRAMLYTSLTITLGFSILALSQFVPVVNFGLLTGFAMAAALVVDFTLLPVLFATFKGFSRAKLAR